MSQRESNIEFLTRIMEYSPHGALVQAFVMEAITQYAHKVSEAEGIPDTAYLSGKPRRRRQKKE